MKSYVPRRRTGGAGRVRLELQMDGPDWPVATREAMARLAGAVHAIVRGGWTISRFQSDWVHLTTAKRDETRVTHAWLAAALGNSLPAEELAREYEALQRRLVEAFPRKGAREAARKAWIRGAEVDWPEPGVGCWRE